MELLVARGGIVSNIVFVYTCHIDYAIINRLNLEINGNCVFY